MYFEIHHEIEIRDILKKSISGLLTDSFDGYPTDRIYTHSIPTSRILVTNKEEVIGHVALHFKNVFIDHVPEEVLGISDFCISPEYRNQEIGRKLFSEVIQFARKLKVKFIISFSAEDTFYQKLNFTNISCRCRWLLIQEGRSLGVMNRFIEKGFYVYSTLESEKPTFKELDLMGPPF